MTILTSDDFSRRADEVVRDYVSTMVLVDDQWPEHGLLPPIPLEELSDVPEVDEGSRASTWSEKEKNDSVYGHPPVATPTEAPDSEPQLLDIEKDAIDKGIVFTGLRFDRKKRQLAQELAREADVLVLDWNLLGTDEGAEALDMIETLARDPRSPKFVYIFTGKTDRENARARITERIKSTDNYGWEEKDLDKQGRTFSVGPLIFAFGKTTVPISLPSIIIEDNSAHSLKILFTNFLIPISSDTIPIFFAIISLRIS